MNQYYLKKDCKELHAFPHVIEFAFKKITTLQFDSLRKERCEFLSIFYVVDGRFSWIIDNNQHVLYPGDLAIVFPGQSFGGEKDYFDIGTVYCIRIAVEDSESQGGISFGAWSRLGSLETKTIVRLITLNNSQVIPKLKEAANIFLGMYNEFVNQEIGHSARINHLIDDVFIVIARQITRQSNSRKDFPQTFMKLEQTLRENLSHQWTVEEMAALVGLGTTAFSEKVKTFLGFSPLNYLINIRILEAMKLLKRHDQQIADLAFTVGFYSSQHFATTFKKLTGYTPSEFRKKHVSSPD